MSGQRSIRRRIRKQSEGIDIAADINAEIAINTGGSGRTTVSKSVHSTSITQTSKQDKEQR